MRVKKKKVWLRRNSCGKRNGNKLVVHQKKFLAQEVRQMRDVLDSRSKG